MWGPSPFRGLKDVPHLHCQRKQRFPKQLLRNVIGVSLLLSSGLNHAGFSWTGQYVEPVAERRKHRGLVLVGSSQISLSLMATCLFNGKLHGL